MLKREYSQDVYTCVCVEYFIFFSDLAIFFKVEGKDKDNIIYK